MARLGVEAGRRLVEQHQLGPVDERAGDGEAAPHPARQQVDPVVPTIGQLDELEQLVGSLTDDAPRQVEVAAVDEHVVAHRQLEVERVLLGHDAETGADARPVGRRVHAQHAEITVRDRRDATDHPHRRRLAGPVGPQEAERLPLLDAKVDGVDSDEVAEALRQLTSLDERGRRHVGRRYRRPRRPRAE